MSASTSLPHPDLANVMAAVADDIVNSDDPPDVVIDEPGDAFDSHRDQQ